MTRKLLILTLTALGLAIVARWLKGYFYRQMVELDTAMIRSQVPFGPLADHVSAVNSQPFSFTDAFNDTISRGDIEADYQSFSFTPVPGSAEAFRAAFSVADNLDPAKIVKQKQWPGRRDGEMGR